jgi:thiol:disulfide interchange protein
MDESQHQPKRQVALNARRSFVAGLVAVVALTVVIILTSHRPKSIEWIPYSAAAVAENTSEGKSLAVLFYSRWTLSADPKGGLVTPTVSQSLTDAGFVTMDADLSDSTAESFDELSKQGFASLPVLVLYPNAGPRVGFDGGTPELEIVSTVERLSR